MTWLAPAISEISPVVRSRTCAIGGPAAPACGSPSLATPGVFSTVERPGTNARAPAIATPSELCVRNLRRERSFMFSPLRTVLLRAIGPGAKPRSVDCRCHFLLTKRKPGWIIARATTHDWRGELGVSAEDGADRWKTRL